MELKWVGHGLAARPISEENFRGDFRPKLDVREVIAISVVGLAKLTKLSIMGIMDAMKTLRSIPASAAKANLGEVLSSLTTSGAVEITRNGRPVGILTAPSQSANAASTARLAELAPLYAVGAVTWHQIADETGAAFGDLLIELGRKGLQLPKVTAQRRPKQQALLDEVLKKSGRAK